jgi:hypothetical protein
MTVAFAMASLVIRAKSSAMGWVMSFNYLSPGSIARMYCPVNEVA